MVFFCVSYCDNLNKPLQYHLSSPSIFIQPISELYKYAPYSQAKLAKYFKEYVGTTIVNYIAKQKNLYTCHLLSNTNFSILKIVIMLNYNSLPHFNRTFKKNRKNTTGIPL